MFTIDGIHGIVVGNAQPELVRLNVDAAVYRAPPQEICATAVLAGLQHFDVLPAAADDPAESGETEQLYDALRAAGDVETGALTHEQLDFIRQGYHKAIESPEKDHHPAGLFRLLAG